jgi:Ca2+-binding EF-hand superfamily protein
MKFGTKILVLAMIIMSISCLNLRISESSNMISSIKDDFSIQWSQLFITATPPPQLCTSPNGNNKNGMSGELDTDGDGDDSDGSSSKTPKAKVNRWGKSQGQGQSAYLFDFFDDILQRDVTTQFSSMFQAAMAIQPADSNTYQDPYALDKLLFIYSNGAGGSANATSSSPDSLSKISQYNKNFNADVWKNSVSASQIYNILQQWGWKSPSSSNPPKKIIDKFDFDGDGRLNPSEFVLFSIINNYKSFGQSDCKQFCYADLIKSKIDPLFKYIDCNSDNFISAENLWIGLKNLKRSTINFSMYICQMPSVLNKDYRTTSTNDFVLKNSRKKDGFLDIEEFRTGVLLGYWDRQTDSRTIYMDDTKNMKSLRWAAGGAQDIVCRDVLILIPGGGGVYIAGGSPACTVQPAQSNPSPNRTQPAGSSPTLPNTASPPAASSPLVPPPPPAGSSPTLPNTASPPVASSPLVPPPPPAGSSPTLPNPGHPAVRRSAMPGFQQTGNYSKEFEYSSSSSSSSFSEVDKSWSSNRSRNFNLK